MLWFINSNTAGKGNVIISITDKKKSSSFISAHFINKFEINWEEIFFSTLFSTDVKESSGTRSPGGSVTTEPLWCVAGLCSPASGSNCPCTPPQPTLLTRKFTLEDKIPKTTDSSGDGLR